MMKPSDPEGPPDVQAAWRRVRSARRRLFEAMADLDEAGGIDALDAARGWSPGERARSLELLRLLRNMIDAEIRRSGG